MRLAHKDFDALQRAILELYQLTLSEGFHKASLQILLKIIPADYSTWNGFTFDPMPKNSICVESSHRMTPAIIAFSERYVLSHPFTRYFLGTGDVSPLKLTDFISQRQLRSSPEWEAYYRPLGVSY